MHVQQPLLVCGVSYGISSHVIRKLRWESPTGEQDADAPELELEATRAGTTLERQNLVGSLFFLFFPGAHRLCTARRRGVHPHASRWLRRKPERTTGSCCEAASSTPRGGSAGAGSTWSYEEPVQPTWGCLLANRCRARARSGYCMGLDTGLVQPRLGGAFMSASTPYKRDDQY